MLMLTTYPIRLTLCALCCIACARAYLSDAIVDTYKNVCRNRQEKILGLRLHMLAGVLWFTYKLKRESRKGPLGRVRSERTILEN